MTNRRSFIAAGLLLPYALATAEASAESILEVHITYTGAGNVDEDHKVYVAVWDSPDFPKDPKLSPIATQATKSKEGRVKFTNLKASTVYISFGYDPTGEWHATAMPSVKVWLGMYGTPDGTPRPIELHQGKTTRVSVTLDNSFHRPPDADGK